MSTLTEDAADLRRRELEGRVAKAMADDMGHGDTARCVAYARSAVRVLGDGVATPMPSGAVVQAPLEPTDEMVNRGMDAALQCEHADDWDDLSGCEQAAAEIKAAYRAMLLVARSAARPNRLSPCQGHAFAVEEGQ